MRLNEAQTLARDIRTALPDAVVRVQFVGGGYILRVRGSGWAEYRPVHSRAEWEGLRPRLGRAALRGAQDEREAS